MMGRPHGLPSGYQVQGGDKSRHQQSAGVENRGAVKSVQGRGGQGDPAVVLGHQGSGEPVHQPHVQQRKSQLDEQDGVPLDPEPQIDQGQKVGVKRPHPVGFVPAPVAGDQAQGPLVIGFAVEHGDGGQVGALQLEKEKHPHGGRKQQQRQQQVLAGARFHGRSVSVGERA